MRVEARYPSGKGEVCKTFMRRFDSDPRLQPFVLLNHSTRDVQHRRCSRNCSSRPSVGGAFQLTSPYWTAVADALSYSAACFTALNSSRRFMALAWCSSVG